MVVWAPKCGRCGMHSPGSSFARQLARHTPHKAPQVPTAINTQRRVRKSASCDPFVASQTTPLVQGTPSAAKNQYLINVAANTVAGAGTVCNSSPAIHRCKNSGASTEGQMRLAALPRFTQARPRITKAGTEMPQKLNEKPQKSLMPRRD